MGTLSRLGVPELREEINRERVKRMARYRDEYSMRKKAWYQWASCPF